MKKSQKENLKIAKQFFKTSFSKDTLDIIRIRAIVKEIKRTHKGRALEILRSYEKLLNRYILDRTITIEAAESLDQNTIEQIRNHFEKKIGSSLDTEFRKNPLILAGIRITLADTQWDYSIKGKIDQIKEALVGKYSS